MVKGKSEEDYIYIESMTDGTITVRSTVCSVGSLDALWDPYMPYVVPTSPIGVVRFINID